MKRRKRSRTEGMTLIEMMVVIVIMALITVAAGINVMQSLETARKRDTKIRARTIQGAAIGLLMDSPSGACPTVRDLETANLLDPTTEHTDAWGNAFEITCEENAVHVRSPGKDGRLESEDDIQLVTMQR